MFDITPDMPLPRLYSKLKLVKGEADLEGAPTWKLYHPLSHQYFQIGWVEFEYLSRFSLSTTWQDLYDKIALETALIPEEDIFKELLFFLHKHGLIEDDAGLPLQPPKEEGALLSTLVHKYLFFSVPLFKPQKFLEATYPYVAFFFRREMTFIAGALFLIGAVMTLGRIDEFLHTFLDLFSWEGAIMVAVLFTIIKIFHELGHAYTAVKYGLKVPHMGVAFMVMYPILYTEASEAWELTQRRKKVAIGLAGIRTELILASLFLMIWNFTAPGLLQSISFGVVAISLLGSLLVNLNPLMRFDGYFILSDLMGIENMHPRSFACAKWGLRKALFGWRDECPEQNRPDKIRFFIAFGWATIIYRFFLFLGIAILVYTIFPKPFGLILMIIELVWFIARPARGEITVWIKRAPELLSFTRGKFTAALATLLIIGLFLPVWGSVSAPAIYHAAQHRSVFAPYPADIQEIYVRERQAVRAGEVLAVLESPELEKDIRLTEIALQELAQMMRRQQTNIDLLRQNRGDLQREIDDLEIKLASYHRKQDQLVIRSAFDGIIRDLNPSVHSGRSINQQSLMFRIIAPSKNTLSAYITEQDAKRITNGAQATFRPLYRLTSSQDMRVAGVGATNIDTLDHPELSSVFGGPIYSERFNEDGEGPPRLVPRQSLYKVTLNPSAPAQSWGRIMVGRVQIAAARASLIDVMWEKAYAFFLPESDVI